MKCGVSTACYYPEPTENALYQLVSHQVPYIEIFLNTFSELQMPFVKRLKEILKQGMTQVISVHPFTSGMEPFLFFSNYKRRFEDGVELYQRYFEFCNMIGAKYVIFHGAHKDIFCEDNMYFERFSKLNETAKTMGIELLQENVARCKSRDVGFIQKMKQQLGDSVHFTLDTKQCIRSEVSPIEMLKAMGQQVRHIHFSDRNQKRDCLLPGAGDGKVFELFPLLQKQNYQGAVFIEVYRQSYREYSEVIQGFHFLQDHMAQFTINESFNYKN